MPAYDDLDPSDVVNAVGEIDQIHNEGISLRRETPRLIPIPGTPPTMFDRFRELTIGAEIANRILVNDKSNFRFCIYLEGETEIFMDLVFLNPKGKIGIIKKRKITHGDPKLFLEMIQKGEGFFIDQRA